MKEPMIGEERDRTLTREDIETLCVLHATSAGECRFSELAERLGLSSDLGTALLDGLSVLVTVGWLTENDGRVSLSKHGCEWLDGRLAELRIART